MYEFSLRADSPPIDFIVFTYLNLIPFSYVEPEETSLMSFMLF